MEKLHLFKDMFVAGLKNENKKNSSNIAHVYCTSKHFYILVQKWDCKGAVRAIQMKTTFPMSTCTQCH